MCYVLTRLRECDARGERGEKKPVCVQLYCWRWRKIEESALANGYGSNHGACVIEVG